jgi:hypothetical protein
LQTGASTCFLQLCGLPSDDLAIDAHAATRIIRHTTPKPPAHSLLVDMFMNLTAKDNCAKALSLLVDASKTVHTLPGWAVGILTSV